jgi:hypothetical protein
VKKIAKEVEVRFDAKKCLTKMDENGYVQDGIGIMMMESDAIVEKKTAKKVIGR